MALNKQTFKTRTLTSIVFVIVMLFGLLLNVWSFLLLFCIIHFYCWREYEKIANLISAAYNTASQFQKKMPLVAGFGLMIFMCNHLPAINTSSINSFGLYLMIICLIILFIAFITNRNFKFIIFSLIGLFYISVACACMINLRTSGIISDNAFSIDFGLMLPLFIIITIWINDTMAYIVGSLIGKTPLSSISPKKTWEGTIGGALLAVATVTICGYFFLKADVIQLIIIATITCIAGNFGDLFESKLKRLANIKDSGNIMPGHGGFLDRFDSLLLAVIFVWLYIKLFL
ncbi:MAG: phosphatidate cytidylyltransferase [Parafilimonas sp.]